MTQKEKKRLIGVYNKIATAKEETVPLSGMFADMFGDTFVGVKLSEEEFEVIEPILDLHGALTLTLEGKGDIRSFVSYCINSERLGKDGYVYIHFYKSMMAMLCLRQTVLGLAGSARMLATDTGPEWERMRGLLVIDTEDKR